MKKELLAEELYRCARENGLVMTLYTVFGKCINTRIPLTKFACSTSVDELDFSVRAGNSLKRAGLFTVGEIADIIESGELSNIRNLGKKTENEIKTRLLSYGYECLNEKEKREFLLNVAEKNLLF